jgi:hypothetical protein
MAELETTAAILGHGMNVKRHRMAKKYGPRLDNEEINRKLEVA